MNLTKPDTARARANDYPSEPYAYHKARRADRGCAPHLRLESARWLIANGVQFENGKFIDPEVLPE